MFRPASEPPSPPCSVSPPSSRSPSAPGRGRGLHARRRRASATRTSRSSATAGTTSGTTTSTSPTPRNAPPLRNGEITAHATQNLSRFDLDLSGMTVRGVIVNGSAADWARKGGELRITPAAGIRAGRGFTVAVRYDGVPKTITGSPDRVRRRLRLAVHARTARSSGTSRTPRTPGSRATTTPATRRPTPSTSPCRKGTKVVANGELHGRSEHRLVLDVRVEPERPDGDLPRDDRHRQVDVPQGRQTPAGIPEFVAFDPDLAHGRRIAATRSSCPARSPTTGRRPSAPTRSTPPARSSTTSRASGSRSRPRAGRCTASRPTRARSRTSSRTSGSATASRSRRGATSG